MDKLFVGEGCVYELDPKKTGLNSCAVVNGSSGTGKSETMIVSALVNNDERSMVVTVNKTSIIKRVSPALIDHGYKIAIMDFTGELSTTGFNPFEYMHTDMDYRDFAEAVIEPEKDIKNGSFWRNSSVNMLTALMAGLKVNASYISKDKMPTLRDFKTLYSEFEIKSSGFTSTVSTSLDPFFNLICRDYRDSVAARSWRAFANNNSNVAMDINSTLYASLQKMFLEEVVSLSSDYEHFDFRRLGREKLVLFIVTSSTNRVLDRYVNVMYKFMISELMDEARHMPHNTLEVPVQLFFDDFACGSVINDFDLYISIFREAGVSAVMLLQSESQLCDMYGEANARTILNNCDTYVYFGGNDPRTFRSIAERLNRPYSRVAQMPIDKVIVMRRGSAPVITERYRIYEDPNYIKYIGGRTNER